MKDYEFLPHTSDEQFRAYGTSLEEAFKNAAYALTDIMTDHTTIKNTVKKDISVEAENNEALLYDFLEHFLFLVDSENFLLHEITNLKISENELIATVNGDDQVENYDINTHIKAVTYQQMFIKKENDTYSLQVIVDI